jgi:hypothetical protein
MRKGYAPSKLVERERVSAFFGLCIPHRQHSTAVGGYVETQNNVDDDRLLRRARRSVVPADRLWDIWGSRRVCMSMRGWENVAHRVVRVTCRDVGVERPGCTGLNCDQSTRAREISRLRAAAHLFEHVEAYEAKLIAHTHAISRASYRASVRAAAAHDTRLFPKRSPQRKSTRCGKAFQAEPSKEIDTRWEGVARA